MKIPTNFPQEPTKKKVGRPRKTENPKPEVKSEPKPTTNSIDTYKADAVEDKEKWRDEMREKWGSRYDADGNSRDYTDAELRELESFYNALAAEYSNAITTRQKNGIIEISSYRLEMKRCIAAGDTAGAKRYNDMINSAMAREAMKAGDVKALEATRIDGLIVNLERKGAIKNGVLIGKKELIDLLAEDHPKYKTSRDVVDAIVFQIINTMKKNNGEAEFATLPFSAQIEDAFNELLTEPTKKEKEAMASTGIVIPQRQGRTVVSGITDISSDLL